MRPSRATNRKIKKKIVQWCQLKSIGKGEICVFNNSRLRRRKNLNNVKFNSVILKDEKRKIILFTGILRVIEGNFKTQIHAVRKKNSIFFLLDKRKIN